MGHFTLVWELLCEGQTGPARGTWDLATHNTFALPGQLVSCALGRNCFRNKYFSLGRAQWIKCTYTKWFRDSNYFSDGKNTVTGLLVLVLLIHVLHVILRSPGFRAIQFGSFGPWGAPHPSLHNCCEGVGHIRKTVCCSWLLPSQSQAPHITLPTVPSPALQAPDLESPSKSAKTDHIVYTDCIVEWPF